MTLGQGSDQGPVDQINLAGRLFLTCRDLDEVYKRTALFLAELAGCTRVAVYAFDAQTEHLSVRATHNLADGTPADFELDLTDAPIIQDSIARVGTVIAHEPGRTAALPRRILRRFEVNGSLGVTPLVSRDSGVVGFACFDRDGQRFDLTPTELALHRACGELAGLAIQNAINQQQAITLATAIERSAIAADLHDGITQRLFSAHLKIDELLDDAEKEPATRNRLLREIRADLEQGSQQLRTALHQLSQPPQNGSTPLIEELRELLMHFADRTGIVVDLEHRGTVREPATRHRALLVRATREALWNIEKYANATEVAIRVAFGHVWCVLEIDDDGEGDTTSIRRRLNFSRSAFGLGSLQRDARALGGRVWISNARRLGGVSLSLSLPLPPPTSDQASRP